MSFKVVKGGLVATLILAYPAIAYYLLTHDLPWLGAVLVIGIITWKVYRRSDRLLILSILFIAFALIAYFLGPAFISKIVPLLIYFTLFIVFWSSLKTTPLITQFARLDFPELPPGIAQYCRSLTIIWAAFFAANILFCGWLAVSSNDKLWALYNGILVYILLAVLVIGEYFWRRVQFPGLEVPSLAQSVENIIKKGPGIWGGNDENIDESK